VRPERNPDVTAIHTFDPQPIPGTRGYYQIELHEGDDDMYASCSVYDGAPNWALKSPESTHQDTTTARCAQWATEYAEQFLPEKSQAEAALEDLLSDADDAFADGDTERYEDLCEQVRSLCDEHPELTPLANEAGVFGGGPERPLTADEATAMFTAIDEGRAMRGER
jgi:hypothetical protein